MSDKYKYTAVGGSDIQVLLEFPTVLIENNPAILHMASALTVSYSVHRAKTPVYNLGQPILDGFGIGKKYVAGSMITIAYDQDEISDFISNTLKKVNENDAGNQRFTRSALEIEALNDPTQRLSTKHIHTIMRDDLTPFNIHLIMSEENYGDERLRRIVIYGANFINNGQVMSIEDIVTENTLSFIGKDIREQHDIKEGLQSAKATTSVVTASSLLK